MAKFKWWKKRNRLSDISQFMGSEPGEYNVTFEGGNWTMEASPSITVSSGTGVTPIHTVGHNEPVAWSMGHSSTILENTITIPYSSVEAVGTPEEFVNRILPDGYQLLEYNINNMEYSSSDQELDIITLHYKAELAPLMVTNESAYGSDDSVVSAMSAALTPQILEDGFSAAIANFGAA